MSDHEATRISKFVRHVSCVHTIVSPLNVAFDGYCRWREKTGACVDPERLPVDETTDQVEVFSDTEAPPAEFCDEEVVFVVVEDARDWTDIISRLYHPKIVVYVRSRATRCEESPCRFLVDPLMRKWLEVVEFTFHAISDELSMWTSRKRCNVRIFPEISHEAKAHVPSNLWSEKSHHVALKTRRADRSILPVRSSLYAILTVS